MMPYTSRIAQRFATEKTARRSGRPYVLLALAIALVASYAAWDMVVQRRLLMGGGGAFPTPVQTNLYALYNGSADGSLYGIGAASFDGSTWTPYGSNPVISVGTSGQWDDATVKDPCLVPGLQYVTYYAGYDGTKYQIGRATASSHTGPWTKYAGNPVLTVGAGGAFDDAGVNFPTVMYDGTTWHMWYGADDGTVQSVGYASSSDGLSWTKHGQVLTPGSSGTWEDEDLLPMAIYKSGVTYNLFYGGRQGTTNPKWQGGVATFTSPTGTYTKSGSNPVLLARFNDSPLPSVDMTADTLTGSAVVTVTGTAWANVGEPVIIVDGASVEVPEVHRVDSIDSGTQITLDAVVTNNFESSGGVLRSFAFNAVLPRTVRAVSGGYEMFGTPFQPIEDLSAPETLYEGSFRWTASSLTGPWTYDYATGLLFPLYPTNTGWDQFSAENPSVVPAP